MTKYILLFLMAIIPLHATAEIYMKGKTYYWKPSPDQPLHPDNTLHFHFDNQWNIHGNRWAHPNEEMSFSGQLRFTYIPGRSVGKSKDRPKIEEHFQPIKNAEITYEIYKDSEDKSSSTDYTKKTLYTDENGRFSVTFRAPKTVPPGYTGIQEFKSYVLVDFEAWEFFPTSVKYLGKHYSPSGPGTKLQPFKYGHGGIAAPEPWGHIVVKHFGLLDDGEIIAQAGKHKENSYSLFNKINYENPNFITGNPGEQKMIKGQVYLAGEYKNKSFADIKVGVFINNEMYKFVKVNNEGYYNTKIVFPPFKGAYTLKIAPILGKEYGHIISKRLYVGITRKDDSVLSGPYYINSRIDKQHALRFTSNAVDLKEFDRIRSKLCSLVNWEYKPEKYKAYAHKLVPDKSKAIPRVTYIVNLLNKYKSDLVCIDDSLENSADKYTNRRRHFLVQSTIKSKTSKWIRHFYWELLKIAGYGPGKKTNPVPLLDMNGVFSNGKGESITFLDWYEYIKTDTRNYHHSLTRHQEYKGVPRYFNNKRGFHLLKSVKNIDASDTDNSELQRQTERLYNSLNGRRFFGKRSLDLKNLYETLEINSSTPTHITSLLNTLVKRIRDDYGWIVTFNKSDSGFNFTFKPR